MNGSEIPPKLCKHIFPVGYGCAFCKEDQAREAIIQDCRRVLESNLPDASLRQVLTLILKKP